MLLLEQLINENEDIIKGGFRVEIISKIKSDILNIFKLKCFRSEADFQKELF